MDAETLKQVAAIIAAIGVPITALGTLVLALMQRKQGEVQAKQTETIKQVEKQGNSVSLELKRTNMVYARRLAEATKDPGDDAIARDAEKLYEAAAVSAKDQSQK